MKLISGLLNIIHFVMLCIPMFIYFVPKKRMTTKFVYVYLGILLVPLHWPFFDDRCVFTILTQNTGGLKNTQTSSPFTEIYLRWLYEPFMKVFSMEWNDKNIEKAVYAHWIVIYILLWYYIFFYNRNVFC